MDQNIKQKIAEEFGLDKLLKSLPFTVLVTFITVALLSARVLLKEQDFMCIDNKLMERLLSPDVALGVVTGLIGVVVASNLYRLFLEWLAKKDLFILSRRLKNWITKVRIDNSGFASNFVLTSSSEFPAFMVNNLKNCAKYIIDLLSIYLLLIAIYKSCYVGTRFFELAIAVTIIYSIIELLNTMCTLKKGYLAEASIDFWHNNFLIVQAFRGIDVKDNQLGKDDKQLGEYQLLTGRSQGKVFYLIFVPDDSDKTDYIKEKEIFRDFDVAMAHFDYLKGKFGKKKN